jgi:hypothetical protein
MLDYQITNVRKYDGTNRTEKAIEVFNAVTGKTISTTRRRPFEPKDAWVARAFQFAVAMDRRDRSEVLARKLGVALTA